MQSTDAAGKRLSQEKDMSIQIATNNEILINGQRTGFGVVQRQEGTRVYKVCGSFISLRQNRYALSCENPASGVPGASEFEADLMEVIGGR